MLKPFCLKDVTCDFQSDDGCLTPDPSNVLQWTRYKGSTGSVDTGPSFDHTLGTAQGRLEVAAKTQTLIKARHFRKTRLEFGAFFIYPAKFTNPPCLPTRSIDF